MSISDQERDDARWQAVLRTARDAIIGIDTRGHVTLFNPTAERMFGYAAKEVIGKNVSMLMPSPYREEHDGYLRNYEATGIPQAIGRIRYVQAQRQSGEVFPIELAVSEGQTNSGVVYTAIIRDVSEQQRLEQAVRRERDFAELVIQTAQVVILVLDPQGRVVHYNAYMEHLSGYPLQEMTGRDWISAFLPERDHARIRCLFEQALAGEAIVGHVNPIVTRDGRERQIEWHARLMHDREGQLRGLLCSGQDVTETIRQQEEIEAKIQQQATVSLLGLRALTSPNLGLLLEDAANNVARTLEVEYVKVLELLPDGSALRTVARVGWPDSALNHDLIPASPGSHAFHTLTSDQPTLIEDLESDPRFQASPQLREHNVVSGIGAIIGGRQQPYGILGAYTTKPRRFTEDDANFLQAVANIIAEAVARERAEAALRESERSSQQRERLADIGAITAKVVHDLGNPLAALSMQAQLILRRAKRGDFTPREPVLQPTEQILATLRRLELLVREFTDFAREQRLELSTFDVGAFLTNTADLWRPLAAARMIELRVVRPADSLTIRADAEKLQRVLDNIVKNAIDAIDCESGEVVLGASLLASGKIQITVEDTGSGIPEGTEVFRLFETTKPQGTGIGLAIAKQLVQAHGGTIGYRGNNPHGTLFEIQLPPSAKSTAVFDPALD